MLFSRLPLRDFDLIVFVAHVGDVDPGMTHLIHGAIAESHPLAGIRVVWIRRGVVIPRGDLQDRALRQEWSRIVRIDVVVMPVEIEIVHMA